ncbi:MAG: hypothetical protein ACREQ9_07910 [Candidatus Binatia bacterium]
MIQLQKTGYRESDYERPNQKWVCGWAAEGNPCWMGPDARGRCTARLQTQCSPRRKGDRYFCTRPDVFGGPCDEGPLPDGSCCRPTPAHPTCQPRLSLRARRGRLTAACVSLALGILALLLASPWRMHFISPGTLSAAHEPVEHVNGKEPTCGACHGAALPVASDNDGLSRWVLAAWRSRVGPAESVKCLDCHFVGGDQERSLAFLVHSTDPAGMSLGREAEGDTGRRPTALVLASLAGTPAAAEGGTVVCGTCHREHRGKDHRLSYMDNVRCQACHREQFASFAEGHPAFDPPRARGGGIRFNHATHRQTHFGETRFDCSRCHAPDAAKRIMLVLPFASSCAGCHEQGKLDHHGERIHAVVAKVFQLPEMELEDPDGSWSEEAALGETLTPMMRLLLAGDDDALGALRSLLEADVGWVVLDWEPDDEEQKNELASAILRLVDDLVDDDPAPLRDRIARALGSEPTAPEVVTLAEQLSASSFTIALFRSRWLAERKEPGDESARGSGDEEEPDEHAEAGSEWRLPETASGWIIDPDEVSVSYRPVAHSDPFLRSWIEALAARSKELGAGEENHDDAVALRSRLRRDLFEELGSGKWGGPFYVACLRCHSTRAENGTPRVDWLAAGRDLDAIGFAKFNHRPHLAILGETESCQRCHAIAQGVDSGSEFLAYRNEVCSSCHAPGQANADCLTCHRYHFLRP